MGRCPDVAKPARHRLVMVGNDNSDRPRAAPGQQQNNPQPFPPTVMVAGIIWTVYGGISSILVFGILWTSPLLPRDLHSLLVLCAGFVFWVLPVSWCLGFLYVGVRCICGRARSTSGIAILSIIAGLLHVGIGATNANWHLREFLIHVPVGLILMVAGVFAATGRLDYLRWRDTHRSTQS